MVSLGWCHVQNVDMTASISYRTPQPIFYGASRPSGLVLRRVRYSKFRPCNVFGVEMVRARNIQAYAVALDQEKEQDDGKPDVEDKANIEQTNGNGSNGSSPPSPLSQSTATMSVHGGELLEGRPNVSDMVTTPICLNSTYTFKNTEQLIAYQEGRFQSFEYGRYGNHTTKVLENKLAALDCAEDAVVSASGMNTATTLLLGLVPAGGHIVTTTDCYRRTRQFIQTMLPRMKITATIIDPADLDGLEAALTSKPTTLFFSETPTNPYLRCVDVEKVVELCHANGAFVVLDGTFATPVNFQPIKWGADLVIHSATKYLAGHNDVLAGAIAGRKDLVAQFRQTQNVLGGVVDPHGAYMVLRGLKTLHLRMQQHNKTAMEIAKRLEAHPKVAKVHYPGLPSHPDHKVAIKYMTGFGGVVSFEVAGGLWDCAKVIDAVRIPYIAPSLGGVESLIEQPAVVSYWDQGAEGRAKVGIKDGLIRFSCGIEDMEDLWADLEQALNSF